MNPENFTEEIRMESLPIVDSVKSKRTCKQIMLCQNRTKHDHKHGEEAKENSEFLNYFVFSPDQLWYRIFYVVKAVIVVICTYLYPYLAAFRKDTTLHKILDEIEIFFFIDFILNFFKEYRLEYDMQHCETQFKNIAKHYLKNEFWWHLVPLVPLQLIPMKNNRQYLCYYIKVIRFREASKYFTKKEMSKVLKKLHVRYLKNQVEKEKTLENPERYTYDINFNEQKRYISFALKGVELLYLIFFITF